MPNGGLGRCSTSSSAGQDSTGSIGKSECQPSWLASGAEPAAEEAERAGLVQEVVEHQDLAAGAADPRHLRHHPLGLRHHRDQVHRDNGVECVVGKRQRARVHALERDDLLQPQRLDPGLGRASISAEKSMPVTLSSARTVAERQTGPDAHLEHRAAAPVDVLDGPAAADAGEGAEGLVVDRRPAPIGSGDRLDLHVYSPTATARRRRRLAIADRPACRDRRRRAAASAPRSARSASPTSSGTPTSSQRAPPAGDPQGLRREGPEAADHQQADHDEPRRDDPGMRRGREDPREGSEHRQQAEHAPAGAGTRRSGPVRPPVASRLTLKRASRRQAQTAKTSAAVQPMSGAPASAAW